MKKPKKINGAIAASQNQRVRVDKIVVDASEFRELNEKKVTEISQSFGEVGQLHAVTVCIKTGWGEDGDRMDLIAGHHRFAAAKKLGWEFINAVVVKRNEKKNRKQQITENLHRSDLTASEKAELVAEWVKLCEEEGGSVAHPQPHDKGISRAAKKLGMSNKSVRGFVKVANLDPDAKKALKRAGLDGNKKVMLEVAKEKPQDQVAKVQEIVARRKKEMAAAKHKRDKAKGMAQGMAKGMVGANCKLASGDDDADDDDRDNDSDTPFDKLVEVWDDTPDFREAWADASARDRRRFIDEVLLADDDGDDDDERDSDGYGPGMTTHLDS